MAINKYDFNTIDKILEECLNDLCSKSKINKNEAREVIAEIYDNLRQINEKPINSYDKLRYLLPLIYKFNLIEDISNVNVQELKNFKRQLTISYNIINNSVNNIFNQINRKIDNTISINNSFETNLQKLSKEELINIIMKNK